MLTYLVYTLQVSLSHYFPIFFIFPSSIQLLNPHSLELPRIHRKDRASSSRDWKCSGGCINYRFQDNLTHAIIKAWTKHSGTQECLGTQGGPPKGTGLISPRTFLWIDGTVPLHSCCPPNQSSSDHREPFIIHRNVFIIFTDIKTSRQINKSFLTDPRMH